jgi:hypothetical protein
METMTSNTVGTFTIPPDSAPMFGRILAGVAGFASTDQARGNITGVKIAGSGDVLTFTATDSYRAVRATFGPATANVGEWETIIHADVIRDVAAAIGKNKNLPVTVAGVVERPGAFTVRIGESPIMFDCPAWNVATFPTTLDSIMAETESGTDRWPTVDVEAVGVNVGMFADTFAVLRKIAGGKRSDMVRVNVERVSATRAWRVVLPTDHGSIVAVLMPMR